MEGLEKEREEEMNFTSNLFNYYMGYDHYR